MSRDTPTRPPETWLAALDRADADLAAGRTQDFDVVLSELAAEDAAETEPNPEPDAPAFTR